jgi:uncharacterized membrane protein YhaH (DUF805 family)
LLGLIGFSQVIGKDFWFSSFGQWIIDPSGQGVLNAVFEKGRAYMAQFNPNYVGLYVGLLIPLFITLMFFSKRLVDALYYGVIIILLLISSMGSKSRAWFIAMAASLVVLLAFFVRHIYQNVLKKGGNADKLLTDGPSEPKTKKKPIFQIALVISIPVMLVVAVLIFNSVTKTNYLSTMYGILKEGLSVEKQPDKPLEDIVLGQNTITVKYNGDSLALNLSTEGDSMYFKFVDTAGNEVTFVEPLADGDGLYTFPDERFSTIQFAIMQDTNVDPEGTNGYYLYMFMIDDEPWYFSNQVMTVDNPDLEKQYVLAPDSQFRYLSAAGK